MKDLVKNRLILGSKVAIVTDTPSSMDIVRKRLLSDKTAQIMLGKFAAAGIDYTQASFLSVAQVRHTRVQYITSAERRAWEELLRRDLAIVQPNVIIAVGETALRALTDHANVEKYRGAPTSCKLYSPCVVMPIEHHSLFFSSPSWQPLVDFYAQKIARYQHSPLSPSIPVETVVTYDEALLRHELLNLNPESYLAFDIESSMAEMTCIGFAKEEDRAFVIPLVRLPMNKFVPMLRLIDEILRSPVKKVAQNGNFDMTYLGYNYRVKVENYAWDTMLAHHSIFPNLPKDLGTVASIYTDSPYWKDDGKQWMMPYDQINWDQFFDYNGKDCTNLITIQRAQQELLAARETEATFQREMDLCKPLVAMEMTGIAINQDKVEELKTETEGLIHKWQLFLDTLLGDLAINVASPDQVKKLLYDQLRLPKRIRGGKLTTDVDALTSLIPLNPIVLKSIMILKTLKKEFSEYKVKLSPDGRMRSTFKPAGTMTGRLASSKSILDGGVGTNFQNRTKKIRVYFEPDDPETQVLVNIDYSKAESWIVAALAEDHKMLDALYGEDFHSANASAILGKPVTKADYSDRQLGKRISHGANYRMTPFLLQKVLLKDGYTFTKSEAHELMEQYHIAYPNIRAVFHRRVEEQLKLDRTLTNCYGRKVTFWDHWSDALLNSATAWEPQGTVGDLTNTGLINIYNNVPEAKLKIQVHDSVVFQLDKELLNQTMIDRLSECMLQEMTINGITFTIPIDIEIGPNWLDLTDWEDVKHEYAA